MKKKIIFRLFPPNEPQLLKFKKYYWTDLIFVDSWIIFIIFFVYWMHLEGAFDSLEIYHLAVGITILIRLWPFVITNNLIRYKNKVMIVTYDEEIQKYRNYLNEYNVLTRKKVKKENKKKLEVQRRAEEDRQRRLDINRQKSNEAKLQNGSSVVIKPITNTFLQQNIKVIEKQPTAKKKHQQN